jgi:hypothetical protein
VWGAQLRGFKQTHTRTRTHTHTHAHTHTHTHLHTHTHTRMYSVYNTCVLQVNMHACQDAAEGIQAAADRCRVNIYIYIYIYIGRG